MKKIMYAILIIIIVAGGIMIATQGLKADIAYSKNVQIDIYIGKDFESQDVKQIAQDVFGKVRMLVQKVELFGDMALVTMKQEDVQNIDEKIEQLNTKINEKYGTENKKEDLKIVYQPKIRLSSIVVPYLIPIAISTAIIVLYAMIRYRKLGVLKTLAYYVVGIVAPEAVYLSLLAITRLPINRLVMPVALVIYAVTIVTLTMKREKKLNQIKQEEQK